MYVGGSEDAFDLGFEGEFRLEFIEEASVETDKVIEKVLFGDVGKLVGKLKVNYFHDLVAV